MEKEVLENHQKYLERKKLNKSFGYDIDKERNFILEQAGLLYGKILEAGTGKGYFALTLARQGYSFVTFDISKEEQRFARLNLAYYGLEKQVDFRIENGEKTSFARSSFHIIFSVNVIHHLKHPYRVVDELIRLRAPGGKLVLSDFTDAGLEIMEKIHGSKGDSHEVCPTTLLDIEGYLIRKGFSVKKTQNRLQCVLVVV